MSVDLVRRETSVLFSMAEYIHMFCSLEGADVHTLKRQMFGAAGIFIEKCYNKNICINRWTLLAYLICFFDSMGKLSSKGTPFPFLKYVAENETIWTEEITKYVEKHNAGREYCPVTSYYNKSPHHHLELDDGSDDVDNILLSKLSAIVNKVIEKNKTSAQEDDVSTFETFSCLKSAVLAYFEEMDK